MNFEPSSSPDALVANLFASLRLGKPQSDGRLTIWPLIGEPTSDGELAYLPLADALEAGELSVSETGSEGHVPHLLVWNLGKRAVLVLFGEEIVGLKQNRIANASFLVPPMDAVVLDVSCVEQGRWTRRGANAVAPRSAYSAQLRKRLNRRVSHARKRGKNGFRSDQLEVWTDVAMRLAQSGVQSPTVAWSDYVEVKRTRLERAEHHFEGVSGQRGFVAMLEGRVLGLELIGSPEVFDRVFATLLRSYLVDAVESELPFGSDGDRVFWRPEPFLAAVAEARICTGKSLGMGRDLRLAGRGVAGCGLVTEEVVHVTVFADEQASL